MKIHVDIVSAEGEIYAGTAQMVFASGEAGDLGIAPRHAPLLTRLRPGEIRVRDADGADETFYVSGGILEVQPHMVTVLADTAERAADIDEAEAQEAKRRAEERIKQAEADIDYARAQAELAEAAARLRLVQRAREGRK